MKEHKVTTYVDEDLYKWLESESKKMGLNMSAYVRVLITKVNNQEKNKG